MIDHTAPEPQPPVQYSEQITDLVIADLDARRVHGVKTYGTPLHAFNGRRALVDLYQELLDGIAYTKQELVERDAFGSLIDRLTENHTLEGTCCTKSTAINKACSSLAQIRVTAIQIGLIRG